ncbi:hypothetical protein, partial [Actinomyces wuliandei]|uniref:hypothetical protein n=1 Tax=Actinomyces wuliandei TaxID=2057743 RepID=UPI001C5822AE
MVVCTAVVGGWGKEAWRRRAVRERSVPVGASRAARGWEGCWARVSWLICWTRASMLARTSSRV